MSSAALQRSPLHLAAEQHDIQGIRTLLDAGCNPALPDRNRNTPLHLCLDPTFKDRPVRQEYVLAAVFALVSARADVNVRNARGESPLHIACAHHPLPVISALLDQPFSPARPDLALRDNRGRTPLHRAVAAGAPLETLEYLVQGKGAAVGVRDHEGSTAADLARKAGRTDLYQFLAPLASFPTPSHVGMGPSASAKFAPSRERTAPPPVEMHSRVLRVPPPARWDTDRSDVSPTSIDGREGAHWANLSESSVWTPARDRSRMPPPPPAAPAPAPMAAPVVPEAPAPRPPSPATDPPAPAAATHDPPMYREPSLRMPGAGEGEGEPPGPPASHWSLEDRAGAAGMSSRAQAALQGLTGARRDPPPEALHTIARLEGEVFEWRRRVEGAEMEAARAREAAAEARGREEALDQQIRTLQAERGRTQELVRGLVNRARDAEEALMKERELVGALRSELRESGDEPPRLQARVGALEAELAAVNQANRNYKAGSEELMAHLRRVEGELRRLAEAEADLEALAGENAAMLEMNEQVARENRALRAQVQALCESSPAGKRQRDRKAIAELQGRNQALSEELARVQDELRVLKGARTFRERAAERAPADAPSPSSLLYGMPSPAAGHTVLSMSVRSDDPFSGRMDLEALAGAPLTALPSPDKPALHGSRMSPVAARSSASSPLRKGSKVVAPPPALSPRLASPGRKGTYARLGALPAPSPSREYAAAHPHMQRRAAPSSYAARMSALDTEHDGAGGRGNNGPDALPDASSTTPLSAPTVHPLPLATPGSARAGPDAGDPLHAFLFAALTPRTGPEPRAAEGARAERSHSPGGPGEGREGEGDVSLIHGARLPTPRAALDLDHLEDAPPDYDPRPTSPLPRTSSGAGSGALVDTGDHASPLGRFMRRSSRNLTEAIATLSPTGDSTPTTTSRRSTLSAGGGAVAIGTAPPILAAVAENGVGVSVRVAEHPPGAGDAGAKGEESTAATRWVVPVTPVQLAPQASSPVPSPQPPVRTLGASATVPGAPNASAQLSPIRRKPLAPSAGPFVATRGGGIYNGPELSMSAEFSGMEDMLHSAVGRLM